VGIPVILGSFKISRLLSVEVGSVSQVVGPKGSLRLPRVDGDGVSWMMGNEIGGVSGGCCFEGCFLLANLCCKSNNSMTF